MLSATHLTGWVCWHEADTPQIEHHNLETEYSQCQPSCHGHSEQRRNMHRIYDLQVPLERLLSASSHQPCEKPRQCTGMGPQVTCALHLKPAAECNSKWPMLLDRKLVRCATLCTGHFLQMVCVNTRHLVVRETATQNSFHFEPNMRLPVL